MKTIPPVDWNHKPACKEPIRELLVRKPLIERVGPVLADLLWTIQGEKRAGRGGKPLPAYCYNIFKIMRKTYFKILPESERLAPCGSKEQDWNALGKVVGAGLRCLSFGEFDLEGILKGESLPAKERADLLGAISAIPAWLNGNGSADAPGAPMASRFVKGSDQLWEACLASQQSACRSGCEPLLQLNKAIDKGLRGFVDESGACHWDHFSLDQLNPLLFDIRQKVSVYRLYAFGCNQPALPRFVLHGLLGQAGDVLFE